MIIKGCRNYQSSIFITCKYFEDKIHQQVLLIIPYAVNLKFYHETSRFRIKFLQALDIQIHYDLKTYEKLQKHVNFICA